MNSGLIKEIDSALINQTKGFLDPVEGAHLYRLASEASQNGPCLEVGSYCGKSALYIGVACLKNGSTLFSIDHHRGAAEQQPKEAYFDEELLDPVDGKINTLPFFRATIEKAGLTQTVIPIVCESQVAAKNWGIPLPLVFIDGGHGLDDVHRDYVLWSRHLRKGGYLLFHDIFDKPEDGGQAPRQIYEMAIASGDYEVCPKMNTLGILKKNIPLHRINVCFQIFRPVFGIECCAFMNPNEV